MPEPQDILQLGNASVVAPAGHGKTELIARIAALSRRSLVLTHTHAGVHAIRMRIKRLGVPSHLVAVDTIAGWCTRYAHAFPGASLPPEGDPKNDAEWQQIYRGPIDALRINAVRQVVAASYDRILVDEYQDCNRLQHELACALSTIVPTAIFGDPMQGIFEFAGANLHWDSEIYPHFPFVGTLETPHRWATRNPELGAWIAETRERLLRGETIDLADPRINYRESSDAFDMGVLFDGIDGKEGSFAAIHCNKSLCYKLASAANGGYQAIEEVAANRLNAFAFAWDHAANASAKRAAILALTDDCFHKRKPLDGESTSPEEAVVREEIRETLPALSEGNGAAAAARIIGLLRKLPHWKLYRSGLWRDAENACSELASGRTETLAAAAGRIKQRASNMGRRLPTRTVSTPLLLKGLEFDHVVIPDAMHFSNEKQAQAKLFYVAISRATSSLTIGSSSRYIRF
jgi:superfamily I DNA/RNA helicase